MPQNMHLFFYICTFFFLFSANAKREFYVQPTGEVVVIFFRASSAFPLRAKIPNAKSMRGSRSVFYYTFFRLVLVIIVIISSRPRD